MEIKVSVRGLVEFLLRTGDIDNRKKSAPDDAMAEGSRIHRMIQKKMGSSYHAEVMLRYRRDCGEYDLVVEGRADGIIDSDPVAVDEIKGTYRDLSRMKEPNPVHLAQAKCYAWMYGQEHGKERMEVSMTYCNIETEEIRYFKFVYEMSDLEEWFDSLLQEYRKWSDADIAWKKLRQDSIHSLSFPFPYREGQKELVTHVYHTICHSRKLFIEAPTGAGKTISTVFPAVKAVGEGKADRIFYLTAKTIARTVADRTFDLLRERGLHFKTVVLTARDKICFMEESECNPDSCPYAKGHFDRINDAIFELMTTKEHYSREEIEACAQKYKVCPFELGLDMSLFSDGILCDYNYVFDPHVYLRRFFGEGAGREQYLFLIDEAHNLLERGREMYSAQLYKEDFLTLKKTVKAFSPRMEKLLDKCNRELLFLKRECGDWCIVEEIDAFVQALLRLSPCMEDYLENHDDSPVRREILDFYFEISHFLQIYELLDQKYVVYTKLDEDGRFLLRLFNVDPSTNLKECLQRSVSSVLFSATLLPIQYYKKLLGGEAEDYEVYAKSVFSPEKKGLFLAEDVTSRYTRRSDREYDKIANYIHQTVSQRHGNYMVFFPSHVFLQQVYERYLRCYEVYAKSVFSPEKKGLFLAEDVTSRYTRRSDREYDKIANYIHQTVSQRHGNYMVFFPSHVFLQQVYERYLRCYAVKDDTECLVQTEHMDEAEREAFLQRFEGNPGMNLSDIIHMEIEVEEESSLVGFCVLGGIFSEGIDLKEDSLIGALIVGTGLPQVCTEREIIRGYFEENGENGFDYAYRYPGMNKVLQAAGRVIRTADDVGIVALLDDRFLTPGYRRLFPREWEQFEVVRGESIGSRVEKFWNDWL